MAITDYSYWVKNLSCNNQKEKSWLEQIEHRPEWGHYISPTNFNNLDETLPYCWISIGIAHKKIELHQLKEITNYLKENIDNPWEGPIGYLGIWKFRFITEEDYMVFKLLR